MSEPIQPHDFDPVSYLCRRCGIAEVWESYRPTCQAPEAAGGASKAEETPSPLERALTRDSWDRIDGRFRR